MSSSGRTTKRGAPTRTARSCSLVRIARTLACHVCVRSFATTLQLQRQQHGGGGSVLASAFVPSSVGAMSKAPFSAVAKDDDVLVEEGRALSSAATLSERFPLLAPSLERLGLTTPTPVQRAALFDRSSNDDDDGNDNLLLIAPTGSGKTLAYLLPAATAAIETDGTVVVVAPTRELAVQLWRDARELLGEDGLRVAVRGVPPPDLGGGARVLLGTPRELTAALDAFPDFADGDALACVVLDEVDALLPPDRPKDLRTALDNKDDKRRGDDDHVVERRRAERRRKADGLRRRGGAELSSDRTRALAPTDALLRRVAARRFAGRNPSPPRVLAGSATASRATLDRLNRSLHEAAREEASSNANEVWGGRVKACRPAAATDGDDDDDDSSSATHTIRAVVVPPRVRHRYAVVDPPTPETVMDAAAAIVERVRPETALLFLCGEYGKPKRAVAKRPPPPKRSGGATSKARRNARRRREEIARRNSRADDDDDGHGGPGLSARRACALLGERGVDALPLHVALGLERTDNDDEDDDEVEIPPLLVTFEGSARGLHFDAVDLVLVAGRPASPASYLHLAGRVGRTFAVDDSGRPRTRPGTIVSLLRPGAGAVAELSKWTRQVTGETRDDDDDEEGRTLGELVWETETN